METTVRGVQGPQPSEDGSLCPGVTSEPVTCGLHGDRVGPCLTFGEGNGSWPRKACAWPGGQGSGALRGHSVGRTAWGSWRSAGRPGGPGKAHPPRARGHHCRFPTGRGAIGAISPKVSSRGEWMPGRRGHHSPCFQVTLPGKFGKTRDRAHTSRKQTVLSSACVSVCVYKYMHTWLARHSGSPQRLATLPELPRWPLLLVLGRLSPAEHQTLPPGRQSQDLTQGPKQASPRQHKGCEVSQQRPLHPSWPGTDSPGGGEVGVYLKT